MGKISAQKKPSIIKIVRRNSINEDSCGLRTFDQNIFKIDIHSVVRVTTKKKQETRLTAPMDGLNLSRGPGCDTPAPKNITGSWNTFGGLNRK